MSTRPFGYDVAGHVATITLRRPERMNALTFEVYRALADTLYELRNNDEVRAVVLAGEGKGFCGGGDVDEIIGELFAQDSHDVLRFTRMTGELIENIRRLDRPVVAAVHGTAAGAGAVIALACDLRVMADTAKIHFLFCKVGLTGADMGAAWLLPRVVGMGKASEWLLLGDGVDAQEAKQSGLATRVTARDNVLSEATALAQRLAQGPTMAHSMTKRLLNSEASMDLSSGIELEAVAQALLLRAKDHRNFYDAYKRGDRPQFEGR